MPRPSSGRLPGHRHASLGGTQPAAASGGQSPRLDHGSRAEVNGAPLVALPIAPVAAGRARSAASAWFAIKGLAKRVRRCGGEYHRTGSHDCYGAECSAKEACSSTRETAGPRWSRSGAESRSERFMVTATCGAVRRQEGRDPSGFPRPQIALIKHCRRPQWLNAKLTGAPDRASPQAGRAALPHSRFLKPAGDLRSP